MFQRARPQRAVGPQRWYWRQHGLLRSVLPPTITILSSILNVALLALVIATVLHH